MPDISGGTRPVPRETGEVSVLSHHRFQNRIFAHTSVLSCGGVSVYHRLLVLATGPARSIHKAKKPPTYARRARYPRLETFEFSNTAISREAPKTPHPHLRRRATIRSTPHQEIPIIHAGDESGPTAHLTGVPFPRAGPHAGGQSR